MDQLKAKYDVTDMEEDLRKQARQVVSILGRLPLAICQMAAFVLETNCDLGELISLLGNRPDEMELLSQDGSALADFYQFNAATAWDLSISALDTPSTALLRLILFLDPDTIPVQLFRSRLPQDRCELLASVGPGLR